MNFLNMVKNSMDMYDRVYLTLSTALGDETI